MSSSTPLSSIPEALVALAACAGDVYSNAVQDDLILAVAAVGNSVRLGPWGGASGASAAPLVVGAGGVAVTGILTATSDIHTLGTLYASNVFATSSMSATTLSSSNLSACNIVIANLSATKAFASNLSACNLLSSSLSTTTAFASNLSACNVTASNLSACNLVTSNLSATTAFASNLSACNLAAANFTTSSHIAGTLVSSNISACNITCVAISTSNLSASNAYASNVSACNVASANLSATNAYTSNLWSCNAYASNLWSCNAHMSNLWSCNANMSNLSACNLDVSNLSAYNLDASNLSACNVSAGGLSTTGNASIGGSLLMYLSTTSGVSVDVGACLSLLIGSAFPPAVSSNVSGGISDAPATSEGNSNSYSTASNLAYSATSLALCNIVAKYDTSLTSNVYALQNAFGVLSHTGAVVFSVTADAIGTLTWAVPTSVYGGLPVTGSNACVLASNLGGAASISYCNAFSAASVTTSVPYSIAATLYTTPAWTSNPVSVALSALHTSNLTIDLSLYPLASYADAGLSFTLASNSVSSLNASILSNNTLRLKGSLSNVGLHTGNVYVSMSNALDVTGHALRVLSPSLGFSLTAT